jgi:hypothetical protein
VSRLALAAAPGTTRRPLRAPALHRDIHVAVPADTTVVPLADAFLDLLRAVSGDIGGD